MGTCQYCGESAGLLSFAHKQCREAHKKAAKSVNTLLESGLKSDVSSIALKRSTEEVAASGRVPANELRKIVLSSMVRWMDEALSDHVLSHEEERRLSDFTEAFDIQVADLDELGYRTKLIKGQILRDLSEGKVPNRISMSGSLPISRAKNESIIFIFQNAEYHKIHTRSQFVGGSSGMSVRVVKGVYLRSSAFKGERIQTSELQSAGTGLLVMTSKNLFFYGSEIIKVPLRKIAGVQPYTDAVGIFKDGQNSKPIFFKLDDPFYAANLISLANSLT